MYEHRTYALSIYLRLIRGSFLDKVESTEFAEGLQQLHDLYIVEITWQTTNEDLVRGIGDIGRDDTGNMSRCGMISADVVFRASDLEDLALEDDAIEAHGCRGFRSTSELKDVAQGCQQVPRR